MRQMIEPSLATSYLLKRTELAVRNCLEVALQQFNLTPNQFLMLLRLNYDGAQSSAQFARAVGVRPQSVTDIIGPLERKGLIERRESSESRRILLINLTAKGRQMIEHARNVTLQLDRDLLAEFDAEEVSVLRKALEKIRATAERYECRPVSGHPEARRPARSGPARPRQRRVGR